MAEKDTKKKTTPAKSTKAAKKETTAKKTSAPAKKAPPRKKVEEKPEVTPSIAETTQTKEEQTPLRVKKSYLFYGIAVGAFIIIGIFLFMYRSLFVAAVVNGQPISRISVISDAEKQAGNQALTNKIRNVLIEQEARKRNITVSDKEVNDELKKVEVQVSKQGQKLDDILKQQGMTKEDLRKLIRLDKLVGKMVEKDVKVSDKEVQDYIDKNKDVLPQNENADQLKKDIKERLKQQKLSMAAQEWLAKLQAQAKITKFVSY